VDFYCDYITSTGVLKGQHGFITSNTPTALIQSPSVGQTNQMQALSIYLTSASAGSVTVTIDYYDGSNPYPIYVISLPQDYTLTYTADGSGWQVYDTNGDRL